MEKQVEELPEVLRKKGLEQKIAEVCRKNDVVFFGSFWSFY